MVKTKHRVLSKSENHNTGPPLNLLIFPLSILSSIVLNDSIEIALNLKTTDKNLTS